MEDTDTVQSESKLHLNSLPSFDLDLDLPIAYTEGVRTCTKHPASKFASYHRLSLPFKAFATNPSSVTTPRTVQDALANPKWREAIYEELRALYKNRTWALADLPSERNLWVVNGYLRLSIRLMDQLRDSRLGWRLKDILRHMELITERHPPLLQK